MNENGGRGNTILLTVIGIATLLVVVVGATFAYFAAIVSGNDTPTSIQVTAADNGITITQAGGDKVELTNIYPRTEAWVDKDLTISTTAATGLSSQTKTTWNLVVDDNSFVAGDIQYTFTKRTATETHVTDITETAAMTNLVTKNDIGHFTTADSAACTVVYNLKVYFVNATDRQQNTNTDQKVVFHLESKPTPVVAGA